MNVPTFVSAYTVMWWITLIVLLYYTFGTVWLLVRHGFKKPENNIHILGIWYAVLTGCLIYTNLKNIRIVGAQLTARLSDLSFSGTDPIPHGLSVFIGIVGMFFFTVFLLNYARALANLTALDIGEFEIINHNELNKHRAIKIREFLCRSSCVYFFLFLEQLFVLSGSESHHGIFLFKPLEWFSILLRKIFTSNTSYDPIVSLAVGAIFLYLSLFFWTIVVRKHLIYRKEIRIFFIAGFVIASYLFFFATSQKSGQGRAIGMLIFLIIAILAAVFMFGSIVKDIIWRNMFSVRKTRPSATIASSLVS